MTEPAAPFRQQPHWIDDQHEPSGLRLALRRLAGALREINEIMVDSTAPRELIERLADDAEALRDRLAAAPRGRVRAWHGMESDDGSERVFHDTSPVIGLANVVAPPLRMRVDGETVEGVVTFGAAYEGPPGHVHGGILAAAFDDVLGATQSATGRPGMTGTLAVRYRRPTPLHREARFTGRIERVHGRKIFTSGTLHVDGVLCAEAEALFISIDFAKMARMLHAGSPPNER